MDDLPPDPDYTSPEVVASVLASATVYDGNHTARIHALCQALQVALAERDEQKALLDAIEHYITWPGPAAVEIYENGANEVVVETSGGRPRIEPVVGKNLRAALTEWSENSKR